MPKGCEILPGGVADPDFAQPAKVEVVEQVGAATTFSLAYPTSISDGDIALVEEAALGPEAPLAVRVTDGDATAILVHGPVTGQRISVVTGGDGSMVEVLGADRSVELAREARVKVWPDTTDGDAISAILLQAGFLQTDIDVPGGASHTQAKHALVQRESDLHLLRRLARRNGCWFWFSYDPATALPTAHVARPPVDKDPVVSFNLAGEERNIDDAKIQWDVERVVAADASARDPFGATELDGTTEKSPLNPLATKPLSEIVSAVRRARLTAPVDDGADLIARSEAALIEQGWFVSAEITASARKLKQVVRACTVAELHGASKRHSGKYLVARVVHAIDDEDHTMTITLIRNGWN